MENPQSLAIESFSYSWLEDKKQENIDVSNSLGDEVKHHLDKNFNFDTCNKSHVGLVDANEIFYDGYMMPTHFLSRSRTQPSTSAPASPFFSFSTPSDDRRNSQSQSKFIKKFKKSSSKVLQKCSGFLRPICKGLGFPRKSSRVDDLGRKVWEVESWGGYLKTPPRSSVAYSAVDWAEMEKERRKSVQSYSMQSSPLNHQAVKSYSDVDSDSIKEAILHCKRSFA